MGNHLMLDVLTYFLMRFCSASKMLKYLLVLVTVFIGICNAFECGAGVGELNKVACLKRNKDVFSKYIANNRDETHFSTFIGEKIVWRDFENSLRKLACECAKRAQEGGYVAFALGYYGECHGVKDRDVYESWLRNPNSQSNQCVASTFQSCKHEDRECVGAANAEYAYTFASKAPTVIDGGYGPWSEYTACSATCGDGIQARERSCNNPLPENGGASCEVLGEATETKKCKLKECPVNGGYGQWSAYGSCSKSCGGGSQARTRKCDSPAPAHGGLPCKGPSSDSKVCGSDPCPVNGGYGKWSTYGSCSKSCGGGSQKRWRKCDSPAPAHGGLPCKGPSSESQVCGANPCP